MCRALLYFNFSCLCFPLLCSRRSPNMRCVSSLCVFHAGNIKTHGVSLGQREREREI